MAYLTWLADVLRDAGLDVREEPGWRTRGRGSMGEIRGVLLHHTAGPATGRYPSLGVVRDGRPGLPGPLAQLGLDRDGTWIVIAAGVANHAGLGYVAWCGKDNGNQHLIGVEAESTGRGDWTAAQLAAYPRGVAALLRYLRLPVSRAIAHKEWAPNRKIDPAGWPGDMTGFRAAAANPTSAGDDDMTPEQAEKLNRIHQILTGEHPSKVPDSDWRADIPAYILGIDAHLVALRKERAADRAEDRALLEQIASRAGMSADELRAALADSTVKVRVEVAGGTP